MSVDCAESGAPRDRVEEGVVVVIHRGRRFLMIRRAAGILGGGAWCFVGGAIKPGETQPEAVVREFAEEVGGRVRPQAKIWEYRRSDGKLLLHWWLAKIEGGALQPNPSEVAELRWCTPEEIEALPNVLESGTAFIAEVGRRIVEAAARG